MCDAISTEDLEFMTTGMRDDTPEGQVVGIIADMAAELLELRAAAQRPPLGYVVLKKRSANTYSVASRIQPAQASAEQLRECRIAELLATDPPVHEEADLFVAEVREVQP